MKFCHPGINHPMFDVEPTVVDYFMDCFIPGGFMIAMGIFLITITVAISIVIAVYTWKFIKNK